MLTSICPICNEGFTHTRKKRFCSIVCRNTHISRGMALQQEERICPICNETFTIAIHQDGTHKLCCSSKCAHISAGRKRSKPHLVYTCPICGKTFSDIPSHQRTYCSRKCMGIAQSRTAKRVTLICAFCGLSFSIPDPSRRNTDSLPRFCSRACSGKWTAQERGLHIRTEATFICEHCGQPFSRMARADRNYRYCSRECSWADQRGEKHHCWQGGHERYYGPNWDEQRLKALERDAYTCQHCSISEDRMNVHHKILRSEFGHAWEAMNSLSNLITLCTPCHTRVHVGGLKIAP